MIQLIMLFIFDTLAVDECEAKSRVMILDCIKRLLEETTATLTLKHSRPLLKVLITSRPDRDILD